MYLFESFVDSEDEPEPNRNELKDDLERAGFGDREIDRALDWLDGLNSTEVTSTAPQLRGHENLRSATRPSVSTRVRAVICCIWNRSASCSPRSASS